jgi:hypothetical protein
VGFLEIQISVDLSGDERPIFLGNIGRESWNKLRLNAVVPFLEVASPDGQSGLHDERHQPLTLKQLHLQKCILNPCKKPNFHETFVRADSLLSRGQIVMSALVQTRSQPEILFTDMGRLNPC